MNAKKKQNTGIIESVYFFGASITENVPSSKKYVKILQNIINKKIINHYAPTDEVLYEAKNEKYVKGHLVFVAQLESQSVNTIKN